MRPSASTSRSACTSNSIISWAQPFQAVAQHLASRTAEHKGAAPTVVTLAFLEFMSPDIGTAGDQLAAQGCTEVTVVPLFLGAGGHVRKDLPVLLAPANPAPGLSATMLEMLHTLQKALAPLGDIDTLKLTERGSWSVELDNDATIELGRGGLEEVLARADRFVRTLPELKRQYPAPLAHADLRYPEGYAVKLRGLTTLQEGQKAPVIKKPVVAKPPAAHSVSANNKPSSSTR